jgi:hypothetical protein
VYILSEIMRLIRRDMRHLQFTFKGKQIHNSESPYIMSRYAEIIPGISRSGTNNINPDLSSKAHSLSAGTEFSRTYENQISSSCSKSPPVNPYFKHSTLDLQTPVRSSLILFSHISLDLLSDVLPRGFLTIFHPSPLGLLDVPPFTFSLS